MTLLETAPLPLLDVAGAREALGGISTALLYRLIAEGQIPTVKIANRTMFRPADLQAFVDANVRGGPVEDEP
jgi:helix-turn-helix protein